MMKKPIKTVALIFALTIIVSACLFSCGPDQPDNTGNTENNDAQNNQNMQENPDATAAERVAHDIPEMDFGGYVFTSIVRDGYGFY